MRNQAVNFQTEISKACSDWVVYYSSVTEVWGFFLFFYFIALFFFFYFIVPKSIPHYRLNTNFATPVSWLSSFISCGVPFFLIFTILYESIYLLFTNENFPVKMLPLFLIEGRQWKWDYRLNFAGLLEYSNLQKVVGNSVHTRLPSLGAHATMDLYQKLNSLFGTELLDNSLRIRTELLKGNRSSFSLRDFNLINSLAHQKRAEVNKSPLAINLTSIFLRFKIEETTKRIITATKGVIVPDSPLIKAHIAGCDVIHSWTVSSLGVRIDAVPGKVYSVKIPFKHYGVFVGQCSEIYGLRHAYMPISITFLPSYVFSTQAYLLVFASLDFCFSRFSRKPGLIFPLFKIKETSNHLAVTTKGLLKNVFNPIQRVLSPLRCGKEEFSDASLKRIQEEVLVNEIYQELPAGPQQTLDTSLKGGMYERSRAIEYGYYHSTNVTYHKFTESSYAPLPRFIWHRMPGLRFDVVYAADSADNVKRFRFDQQKIKDVTYYSTNPNYSINPTDSAILKLQLNLVFKNYYRRDLYPQIYRPLPLSPQRPLGWSFTRTPFQCYDFFIYNKGI